MAEIVARPSPRGKGSLVRGVPFGLVPVLILFCLLALSACGKKGNPTAPGPADQIIYPHTYPSF